MPRGAKTKYPVSVGDRFGRRVVIGDAPPLVGANGRPRKRFAVRCDCGVIEHVLPQNLRTGSQCNACRTREMVQRNLDGAGPRWRDPNAPSRSPEYGIWKGMRARCHRPSSPRYPDYGGRGIRVCERWRKSFAAFFADVGPKPGPDYSLDRVNNDGDYEPGNVRWTTRSAQQLNRRDSLIVTIGGVTKHIRLWAAERGLSFEAVRARLRSGLSPEEALTPRRGDRWHPIGTLRSRP